MFVLCVFHLKNLLCSFTFHFSIDTKVASMNCSKIMFTQLEVHVHVCTIRLLCKIISQQTFNKSNSNNNNNSDKNCIAHLQNVHHNLCTFCVSFFIYNFQLIFLARHGTTSSYVESVVLLHISRYGEITFSWFNLIECNEKRSIARMCVNALCEERKKGQKKQCVWFSFVHIVNIVYTIERMVAVYSEFLAGL